MFYIMDTLSTDLINFIDKKIPERSDKIEMNVREMAAMYSTDVIASAAYGLKANTLENPDGGFRQVGKRLYTFSFISGLGRFLQATRPEIVPYLGYKRFDDESSDFIRTNVKHVMEEREKTGEIRHDLIDILNELKKMDIRDVDGKPIHDDVLYAQAAVFFIGKLVIEFFFEGSAVAADSGVARMYVARGKTKIFRLFCTKFSAP